MEKISNIDDFDLVIKEGKVVIDFYANWCGPCKMLAPIMEELSEENKDIKFIKVDVDEVNEAAARFGVMSIPSIFFVKDGKVVANSLGYLPKEEMQKFIDKNK